MVDAHRARDDHLFLVQLSCSCGCVDKHARMEDIMAMREQHKKESGKERREYMRTEGAVPDASKKLWGSSARASARGES